MVWNGYETGRNGYETGYETGVKHIWNSRGIWQHVPYILIFVAFLGSVSSGQQVPPTDFKWGQADASLQQAIFPACLCRAHGRNKISVRSCCPVAQEFAIRFDPSFVRPFHTCFTPPFHTCFTHPFHTIRFRCIYRCPLFVVCENGRRHIYIYIWIIS